MQGRDPMPSASDTHDTRTPGRPGAAPAVFSPRGGLHEAPLARGLGAHGARPPAKDLGPAVDRMLAESGAEKPGPRPPAADEPAAKEIQSLDQQLAKAADGLIAGESVG